MVNEVRPSGEGGKALGQRLAVELTRAVVQAEKRFGRTLDRRELARRLNVSASSLYAYLNGTTLPGGGVLDALLTELGVPGPEAGLATLRDEADAVRRLRPTAARTHAHQLSATLPVPRQLPLSHPVFVARDAELARLEALRSPSGDPGTSRAAVAVVEGTAGVGKTALALHWAHRRRPTSRTASSTSTCRAAETRRPWTPARPCTASSRPSASPPAPYRPTPPWPPDCCAPC